MSEEAKLPEVESLTFRQGMTELSQIVQALESNTLELEESLVKYERGIALLRYLKGSLDNVQQKIDVLMGELDAPVDDAVVDTTLRKA
jgi:exodeoxyribonuclease VII small subunit